MKPLRMAGSILGVGGLGAGGAFAADALAHDEMDRLAQGAIDLNENFSAAPAEIQQAYTALFAQGEMSNMDRIITEKILDGTATMPGLDEPIQADTPAGKKAIKLAAEIRQSNPSAAAALAVVADQENRLFMKEAAAGVSTGEVMQAMAGGAGVSLMPAIAGGATIGAGTAIVDALMRRRNQ